MSKQATASAEPTRTVYAIRCDANGKVYIGFTTDVQRRIYQHFNELKSGRKTEYSRATKTRIPSDWQKDYDQYGKNAFSFYVLESGVPRRNGRMREMAWIVKYNSNNPKHGYNAQYDIKPEIVISDGLPPLPEVAK